MDSGSIVESYADVSHIEQKCRLCLKSKNTLLLPVSSENLEGSVVALQIDILTSVKVAPTDKICTVCRLKIKKFYAFRVMCIRSDTRIRGESNNSSEENEVSEEAVHGSEISLSDNVSVMKVPDDLHRSYKRQRKVEHSVSRSGETKWKQEHIPDTLSITPLPSKSCREDKNGIEKKKVISFNIPVKIEAGSEEDKNGLDDIDYDDENDDEEDDDDDDDDDNDRDAVEEHEESSYLCNQNGEERETSASQDGSSSHVQHDANNIGEETENLEVQVDPFMLMADDGSDHEQASSGINVRGHMLYPVLGNQQPMSQKPIMPLLAGRRSDRERALELIKQMTTTRKAASGGDGSFLDKPFKCDMCPESFSYYKSFLKHKQRHTGDMETFSCDFCSETFHTSRLLQNHLKYHNIEKAFPCDQCERSFPTKERLQSHYTLHTGNKPFVCEICNKSFAYKSSYGLHIRKQHGEQPIKSQSFKCDKCPQEYDIFGDLKRHLRTHLGEKPFTCHVCSKAFASKSILNVHSRIHNGFKPYRCEVCNQAFTQKQSLDYHMRRHSDENPFKCKHCGVTFRRRHFLDKHVEVQHGGNPASSSMIHFGGKSEKHEVAIDEEVGGDGMEEAEEQEDDDMDSDPLRLEIDESFVKIESDENIDSVKTELTE